MHRRRGRLGQRRVGSHGGARQNRRARADSPGSAAAAGAGDQPASREAIAKAEAAIRSVVESVDQGEPCWYYVDPQVARRATVHPRPPCFPAHRSCRARAANRATGLSCFAAAARAERRMPPWQNGQVAVLLSTVPAAAVTCQAAACRQ